MVALASALVLHPSEPEGDARSWQTEIPVLLPALRNASSSSAVSRKSVGQSSDFVPTDVGDRVVGFLRRLHPSKTAVMVATDTGCGIDAVEKWLERASVPNGRAMLRLFLAYGPDFICAVVDNPPAWLDARQSAARQIELESSIARQRAELEQLRAVSA